MVNRIVPAYCEVSMSDTIDILGVGCVAVDDLLYVPAYPPPDTKAQVMRSERQCGGLTATALVAASRLGVNVAYVGTLGDDELSNFVRNRLHAEGIDTTGLLHYPSAGPIHSVIVVDEAHQTRNVFSNRVAFLGAPAPRVDRSMICRSRVLLVDHVAPERQIEPARLASSLNIPIVADFERDDAPGFEELIRFVDHLVVSRAFAERRTGEVGVERACRKLVENHHTVVVTDGAKGAWFATAAEPTVEHRPAFVVEAKDTTGCGDVFHGAYAAALVRGMGLAERVRYASGAAALKATRSGGQAGCPKAGELRRFLQNNVEIGSHVVGPTVATLRVSRRTSGE